MSEGQSNTDRELWWEQQEGYRASIHVTRSGGVGINVGGNVIVKPLLEWHSLARTVSPSPEQSGERSWTFSDDPLGKILERIRMVVHPLTQQGEDRIWRAAEKACLLLDEAEDALESVQAEIARLTAALRPYLKQEEAITRRPPTDARRTCRGTRGTGGRK